MVIDDPGETAAFNIVLLIDSGKQRFFCEFFSQGGPWGSISGARSWGMFEGPSGSRWPYSMFLVFYVFCCCSFGRCLCRCRWPYFRAISIHGKWWAISSAKPGRKIQKHTNTNTIASPVRKYKTKIQI